MNPATSPALNDAAIPLPGRAVWGVSIAVCLMFMGMMHDFRSAHLALEDIEANLIDGVAAFEQDVSAALPERKAGFVLSALLAVYCLATTRRRISWESPLLLGLIVAGLLWTCASVAWSVDPSETARELVRVFVYSALALGLAIRFTAYEFCWMVLLSSIFSVLVACAFEVVVGAPSLVGDTYRLTGSLHPNPLGRFATQIALPALAFALASKTGRWKWLFVLACSLIVIELTKSRTSLACCVLGLGTVFALTPNWGKLVLPASLFAIVCSLGVLVLGAGGQAALEGSGDTLAMGRQDQVGSLTGRLPLWEALLNKSASRRLQGFGYGAFWSADNNEAIQDEVQWTAGHSHSVYVETLMNLGAVGLILLVGCGVLATARCAWIAVTTAAVEYRALASVMVAALLNGFTESGYILPRELAIFSLAFAFCAALTPAWRVAPAFQPRKALAEVRRAPLGAT